MLKYIYCQHVACFEIPDAFKHVYFLYKISFSRRLTKEWVLMINQLLHVISYNNAKYFTRFSYFAVISLTLRLAKKVCNLEAIPRDHSFISYGKSSGKLTFLTPWYAHVRVRFRGEEMLVFREILHTT